MHAIAAIYSDIGMSWVVAHDAALWWEYKIALILCVFAYVDPMLSTLSIVCQITVNRECIQSVGIEL